MTVDDMRQRLDKEAASLAKAREAVAGGQDINLDDLEGRIRTLCRDVEAMPRAEARALIDDVQRLLAALDELAAAICTAGSHNPGARTFPVQPGRP